jgi:cation transport regulator ChaC
MTREIVIRIPEERAREMLRVLSARETRGSLADLRDLLQRAMDEAAAERLRQERD